MSIKDTKKGIEIMARKKEKLENKNQEETKVEITEQPTEEVEQSSE